MRSPVRPWLRRENHPPFYPINLTSEPAGTKSAAEAACPSFALNRLARFPVRDPAIPGPAGKAPGGVGKRTKLSAELDCPIHREADSLQPDQRCQIPP